MKQAALSILLTILLTSCVHVEQKCGTFVDKWREGRDNQSGIVAVNYNGTTYQGNVTDEVYANAKARDRVCVEVFVWE
jgi:hypothetical protein